MVYLDQDVVTHNRSIACLKCGNRWPGGVAFYMDGKREDEEMAARRECNNCRRVMQIVRDGLCGTCNHAAGDLEGEERQRALAAVKERIARGDVKTRGSKPCKAGAGDAPPPAKPTPVKLSVSAKSVPQIGPMEPASEIFQVLPREIPVIVRLELEIGIRFMGIEG
jgi:hypothetical protein